MLETLARWPSDGSLDRAFLAAATNLTDWTITDLVRNLHFPAAKTGGEVVPAYKVTPKPVGGGWTMETIDPDATANATLFNRLGMRQLFAKARWYEGYTLIGIGFHPIQDSFAHRGKTAGVGHAGVKPDVDDPKTNIDIAMEMARTTYTLLELAKSVSKMLGHEQLGNNENLAPDWDRTVRDIFNMPAADEATREKRWVAMIRSRPGLGYHKYGTWNDVMRELWEKDGSAVKRLEQVLGLRKR